MPFVHIVLLKFKESTTQEQIDAAFKALSELPSKVSGLIEYSGGKYDSPEGLNRGLTHGFTMKFVDRESRDNYFPHPDHEVVKNLLFTMIEVDATVCFDYEV
jgi:hypothetical protein